MYDSDSFFTLSDTGQIGLAALSLVLAGAMLFVTYRVTRGRRILLRLALAIVLFAAFEWLSPQVYYTYYRVIIPGLPLQWVIDLVPNPGTVPKLLTFTQSNDLSAHGRGVLGWAMLVVSGFTKGRSEAGPSRQ